MSTKRLITAVGLLASASIAYSACAPAVSADSAHQPPTAEAPANEISTGPEMWIHGIGNTERLSSVSARGVRLILNIRKELAVEGTRRKIGRLANSGLGLVITIRWQDPNIRKRPVKLDAAPSAEEARQASDNLLAVLNSPEAKRMAGNLWVQFYNEVTGGPGTIMPEQADGMYEFATQTAERIRREAPHVKIAGPALTALDPLDSVPAEGSQGELRREGLLRAIRWSIKNADAIDIHLHCAGGDDARHQLAQLRAALDREGRPDLPILALEWSPARFPARAGDLPGAQQAMKDIYQAMAEQHVVIAAYAAFADTPLADTYEWAYLWDAQGRPHDPFFSLFKDLAEAREQTPVSHEPMADPASPDEPEEPER